MVVVGDVVRLCEIGVEERQQTMGGKACLEGLSFLFKTYVRAGEKVDK